MTTLNTLLGRDAARSFLISAARAIHTAQARVVANARFAHREGRRHPFPDAVPPPQAALSPTTPSTAPTPAPGCAASKFFVPLIHAAHADHLTRNAGPAPPPEITAIINAAHQAYDLWAADVVVPSWTATIRAIVPPIAGWPEFSAAYIPPVQQVAILKLTDGALPPAIRHVHDWVASNSAIAGWRAFTRATAPPRRPDRRFQAGHSHNPIEIPDDEDD